MHTPTDWRVRDQCTPAICSAEATCHSIAAVTGWQVFNVTQFHKTNTIKKMSACWKDDTIKYHIGPPGHGLGTVAAPKSNENMLLNLGHFHYELYANAHWHTELCNKW